MNTQLIQDARNLTVLHSTTDGLYIFSNDDHWLYMELYSDKPIVVVSDNTPLGRSNALGRLTLKLKPDQKIDIFHSGDLYIDYVPMDPPNEAGGGEPLVEVIPTEELSLFDRLRAEMMQKLEDMAVVKGMDTYADEEELDYDDEEPDILTPYEYVEMVEEQPEPVAEGVNNEVVEGNAESDNPAPAPEQVENS